MLQNFVLTRHFSTVLPLQALGPVLRASHIAQEPTGAFPCPSFLAPWLSFEGDGTCEPFEYINIRGHECHNCTALFGQRKNSHAQCDSFHGPDVGCQLASKQEAVSKGAFGEDNFGTCAVQNPAHRCTSTLNSTTQWWLG